MFRDRKRRAVEVFDGVTLLTTILVWGGCKLLVMGILVAIPAGRKFDLVDRVFSRRRMTFVTGDSSVLSFQRIVRGGVLFHAKLRGLPSIYCVALGAFAFAGTRLELAFMGVGGVAIRALSKWNRFLEIS